MPHPAKSAPEGQLPDLSVDEDAAITAAAAADPDNPIWTDEDFARARPGWEAIPHLVEMQRRRGFPPMHTGRAVVAIPLSTDVLAHFRALGDDWQERIDETLRKAMEISDLGSSK